MNKTSSAADRVVWIIAFTMILSLAPKAIAQPLGEPYRGSPGDAMIQAYLANESAKLSARFADDIASLDQWQAKRAEYVEQYLYMLGLSPRPESSPLNATVTGTLNGDGYAVDMLHYQSRPGLYVTGNLYRPAVVEPNTKLPAIFYVCGHSGRGRHGNKVAYQSHGIWFARHGFICLVVDTLQLGEIAAVHHGTYNLERWWWHARGYTPAGVEAWNGIRGIDYLLSRPDVDAQRIGVTGISGGGAATFWIAAADPRVAVAVPVSGMADLESYVPNRVINGHCDCMFFYNTFQWPWTRIANLIAPRPMLFINSDHDNIFPMDANERISNRLERVYSLFQASQHFDTVVSVGGHAYRKDIRQAAFSFLRYHLQQDARPVTDSEIDIVSEGGNPGPYPIPPERLRVFPADADLPSDSNNKVVDEQFVPLASVTPPAADNFASWKQTLLGELRRVSFAHFPQSIPAAKRIGEESIGPSEKSIRLESEDKIEFQLRIPKDNQPAQTDVASNSILLVVLDESEASTTPAWVKDLDAPGQQLVLCEPRGVGATQWTQKNPPNYVQRSHALLGRTVDSGRVWDIVAAAKYLAAAASAKDVTASIHLAGKGNAGLLSAYAAILEPQISRVTLISPPATHSAASSMQLLNVLRVCDVPDALGLLAPRPLIITGAPETSFKNTITAFTAANAAKHLIFR